MKIIKFLTIFVSFVFCCTILVFVSSPASQKIIQPAPAIRININTASVEELERLPGISTRTARSIIEYRKKNEPFRTLDDLIHVKGIGSKTIEKLKRVAVEIDF